MLAAHAVAQLASAQIQASCRTPKLGSTRRHLHGNGHGGHGDHGNGNGRVQFAKVRLSNMQFLSAWKVILLASQVVKCCTEPHPQSASGWEMRRNKHTSQLVNNVVRSSKRCTRLQNPNLLSSSLAYSIMSNSPPLGLENTHGSFLRRCMKQSQSKMTEDYQFQVEIPNIVAVHQPERWPD